MVKKKTAAKRIKLADNTKYPFPNAGVPQAVNGIRNNGGPAPANPTLAPTTRPDYSKVGVDGTIPAANTPFPAALGAGISGPNGTSITANPNGSSGDANEAGAFQAVKMQTVAAGNSGTQIFGGYFSEEYLPELRGRRGAKMWDEMRRSEAQIAMLMNAIMNPIKAANWEIEPHDAANPEYVKHADLVKMAIMEMIDFNTFKHEALTVIPFGFSLFEVVHSVVLDHPKFGTFNGLKALAFRSQKTIENWQLEQKTGDLIGVNQYTYSDLGGNNFIPGEFLLVITNCKEGDNYEGISALRSMVGAYKRKDLYLKLAAIGVERYAIGTPVGTIPAGKEKSKEYAAFIQVLQNYTSHEASYIVKPAGWEIEIEKGEFDAAAIKELLIFENTEFANAVVGNFLALGMNGGGGAYALGSNLGEFFTTGIQSYADLATDGVNRGLIPNLVKLNFGEQPHYPKMKCTGISDKAGKELAETIKFLSDARVLDPDGPLKDFLRKQYKLPKVDVNTATAMPAIPAGAAANYPKPNDPVVNPKTGKIEPYDPSQLLGTPQPKAAPTAQLSEAIRLSDAKYVARFDKNKSTLKMLMQTQLSFNYQAMKGLLRAKYKSLSGAQKITAATQVDFPGVQQYKGLLRDALAEVAAQSIASARKLVPNKKNVKLSSTFDALSPKVRALINTQASLVAETQAADLDKVVSFTFTSTASSETDIDTILTDVDAKVLPMIDGSTAEGMSVDVAAGDAVAHVTQQAAMSFFSDPDVVEGIESFTFTNEDPVSDICIAMVGTTVSPDDPLLDEYCTPLHHNCKSRWTPNLKGDSDNPDIGSGDAQENGGVSVTKKALASMTLCEPSRGRMILRF